MKRRFSAFLLAICLSFLIVHPWQILATDYGTYDNLLLTRFAGHIIGLWPLNETAGTTANDISGNGYNGTYTGVTLNQADGAGTSFGRAGLWDGINDCTSIFSSGLATAFTKNNHTLSVWFKVQSGTVWTDGAYRTVAVMSSAGFTTGMSEAIKNINNNQFIANIYGNNTGGQPNKTTSETGWVNYIITSNGTVGRAYWNNSQVGTDVTRGTWSDALTIAAIGCRSANLYFQGYIQQMILLDYDASADDRAVLANASPPEATNTPTATNTTTATYTPRPPQMIMTLTNGNQIELDYTITAGQIGQFVPILLFIGLFIFIMILKLVKR